MFRSQHILNRTVLFERPAMTADEAHAQLAQLKQQQLRFAALTVTERTELLLQLAHALQQQRDALAMQICIEVGRCLRECEAELDKSVALIRYYAQLAPELLADQTIATQASLSQVRFEPLGVVLAVMPWNYPVWQILRFAIPALCAGNACWVKPAPSVAGITQRLFELVPSELPFQAAWLANEDVETALAACQALAFTGSTTTGRHLAALAGRYLKKSVLELGGSNAFVVLEDADIDQAAQDACHSRFRDAGQSCNAAKRLIVVDALAEAFIESFLHHCRQLRMGAPWLPETTLAPLHRADLRLLLHQQVEDALHRGARCLLGGQLPEDTVPFYPATVLDHVQPSCRVYREEVFGPVASIIRARDAEQAINLANDSPYGLGASIYSRDEAQAWQWASKIQAGSVFINRHTSSDLRLPFGGVKDSGFGRELSEFGLYEFVNVKAYWQK